MIPKPIYELLPYTYMGIGLIALISIESTLGQICGLILIIIGIVIHQTRWSYRHRKLRLEDLSNQNARARSKHKIKPRITNAHVEPISRRQVKCQEDFLKGENSYEQGDYPAALKWYRKAAEQGHASAQINLGAMYAEGLGTARNFQEALRWYHKAAEQNSASAQFNLGVLHEQGGGALRNLETALSWYGKAAEQGYAPAQLNLGAMYAEGSGVDQDIGEALNWYHKAADQGYALAHFNLGMIYAEGQEEIPQDLVMAYVWFSRSSVLGDQEARNALKAIGSQLSLEQKEQAQMLLQTSVVEEPSGRNQLAARGGF